MIHERGDELTFLKAYPDPTRAIEPQMMSGTPIGMVFLCDSGNIQSIYYKVLLCYRQLLRVHKICEGKIRSL